MLGPDLCDPIPWHVERDGPTRLKIVNANGEIVAEALLDDQTPKFIVLAANMFHRLVAQLERCLDVAIEHGDPFSGGDHEFVSEIRALIREAKGGDN